MFDEMFAEVVVKTVVVKTTTLSGFLVDTELFVPAVDFFISW